MLRLTRTARDPKGIARVTLHQRPQVGAVGFTGTGKAGVRTSPRAAAVTPAARCPAMPSPTSPIQSTTATARPSHPAQFDSAPAQTKRPVATACQKIFWKASSPAIQPQVKLRTVNGSRRMGR